MRHGVAMGWLWGHHLATEICTVVCRDVCWNQPMGGQDLGTFETYYDAF